MVLVAGAVLLAGSAVAQVVPEKLAPVMEPASNPSVLPVGQQAVASPSVDTLGILGSSNGGLGTDMWAGTPGDLVLRLVPKIPVKIPSAVLRDLTRRLLLTAARAPEGAELGDASGGRLLDYRVDKLLDLGDREAVGNMMRVIPKNEVHDQLAQTDVKSMLISNKTSEACEQVSSYIKMYNSVFWQKAFVFCQSLASNNDKARLSMNLLQESGHADPVFSQLIDRMLSGSTAAFKSFPDPDVLNMAILNYLGISVPADVVDRGTPLVVSAVANSPYVSSELKVAAAERATVLGALSPKILGQLYSSFIFKPEDLIEPNKLIEKVTGIEQRAFFYQATRMQGDDIRKAQLLENLWGRARKDGTYLISVMTNEGVLNDIDPAGDLMPFAGNAARAYYALGQGNKAATWIDLVMEKAPNDPKAKLVYANVWPLHRLAQGSSYQSALKDEEAFSIWLQLMAQDSAIKAQEKAGVLLMLLDALGEPLPFEPDRHLLQNFTKNMNMPSTAVVERMQEAAKAGRVGETVLLMLLTLEEEGAKSHPLVLHEVIVGLRRIGLKQEARMLAVEAAIDAGL